MASSSVLKVVTPVTGPKISSWKTWRGKEWRSGRSGRVRGGGGG
jgi:hypothetical protein